MTDSVGIVPMLDVAAALYIAASVLAVARLGAFDRTPPVVASAAG